LIPAPWRPHAFALAGYVVVALAFVWPLPLTLHRHLTGPPGGDTGVYVWNQWVFQHEILEHRHRTSPSGSSRSAAGRMKVFRLQHVETDGSFELYRTAYSAPPMAAAPR
jgi:hypothetical protein